MKVLVINGDCVTRNSSANLCHMAYIRGLVNLGYEVTLLSADPKEYDVDKSMIIPSSVKCIYYYGTTIYEKMSISKSKSKEDNASLARTDYSTNESKLSIKSKLVNSTKNFVLSSYGIHGIYSKFVKKAQKFKSDTEYDIVLSLSTPVTSHLLTYNLLEAGHIKTKKWIQVWEDPWYVDVYGFNEKEKIYKEKKDFCHMHNEYVM